MKLKIPRTRRTAEREKLRGINGGTLRQLATMARFDGNVACEPGRG